MASTPLISVLAGLLGNKIVFLQVVIHHTQESRVVVEIENEPAVPATFESEYLTVVAGSFRQLHEPGGPHLGCYRVSGTVADQHRRQAPRHMMKRGQRPPAFADLALSVSICGSVDYGIQRNQQIRHTGN